MRSRPVQYALRFAFGLVCSGLIAEATLHLIEMTPLWRVLPVVERELGWPDPNSGYSLRPSLRIINVKEHRNIAETNAFAMRDRARVLAKPQGVQRIVVMGDSYTEAIEVGQHETFTALVEARLNDKRPAPAFEVLNFGVIGSGPLQQLFRWRSEARRFGPDVSVFVVDEVAFRTSEITDDAYNPAYVFDDAGKLAVGFGFRARRSQRYRDHWIGKTFFWLMDHSRTIRGAYLRHKLGNVGGRPPGDRFIHRRRDCAVIASGIEQRLRFWRGGRPLDYVARLQRYLSDFEGSMADAGSRSLVLLYGLGIPRPDCPASEIPRAELRQAIEDRFAAAGIRVGDIDFGLYESDPDVGVGRKLFGFGRKLGQGHLNRRGHAAFADVIVRELRNIKGVADK